MGPLIFLYKPKLYLQQNWMASFSTAGNQLLSVHLPSPMHIPLTRMMESHRHNRLLCFKSPLCLSYANIHRRMVRSSIRHCQSHCLLDPSHILLPLTHVPTNHRRGMCPQTAITVSHLLSLIIQTHTARVASWSRFVSSSDRSTSTMNRSCARTYWSYLLLDVPHGPSAYRDGDWDGDWDNWSHSLSGGQGSGWSLQCVTSTALALFSFLCFAFCCQICSAWSLSLLIFINYMAIQLDSSDACRLSDWDPSLGASLAFLSFELMPQGFFPFDYFQDVLKNSLEFHRVFIVCDLRSFLALEWRLEFTPMSEWYDKKEGLPTTLTLNLSK